MFEFLFKYPLSVFTKGTFVLLGSWPRWVLFLGILAAAGALAMFFLRRREQFTRSMRGKPAGDSMGPRFSGDCSSIAAALATSGFGDRAEAAAEHHCRSSGR